MYALQMNEGATFSSWMKSARLRAGLTQEELARRGEFDDSYINKIERGKIRLPNLETRQRIHESLGTTEEELIALGIVKGRSITVPAAVAVSEALPPTVITRPTPIRDPFIASLTPEQRNYLRELLDAEDRREPYDTQEERPERRQDRKAE